MIVVDIYEIHKYHSIDISIFNKQTFVSAAHSTIEYFRLSVLLDSKINYLYIKYVCSSKY